MIWATMYRPVSRLLIDAVGPIDEGDDRVEVGAGDRPEDQDQPDQRAGGGGGVLEQLQADVARREPAGHDPGADDGDDQQAGAERLGDEPPRQLDRDVAGAGLRAARRARSRGTRHGGDALAELGDGSVERLRRAHLRPGRGSTSAASPAAGSSSSWARSHTVIVSGGRRRSSSSDVGVACAEVEAGTLGGGDRAGMDPLGRMGAGARRRAAGRSRSTGRRRAASGPSSRVHTNSTGPVIAPCTRTELVRAGRGSGGRSGDARRRWTGCARSARPPRARRGDGPAGSTAPRRRPAAPAATGPSRPAGRRSPGGTGRPARRAPSPVAPPTVRITPQHSISLSHDETIHAE